MEIQYDEVKNKHLQRTRGIGFEDVKRVIMSGDFTIENNPKAGREHQKLIIFEYNGYPHICPYVENETGIFLKTIFKDRNYKQTIQEL